MLQEGSVSEMGAAAALQHGAEAVRRHHHHPCEHVRHLSRHSGEHTHTHTRPSPAVSTQRLILAHQMLKLGIKHNQAC